MTKRYFVFVDESWNNDHDDYFGLWCLLVPVEKIWEYHEAIKTKAQQIMDVVKRQEEHLKSSLTWDDLLNFLKGRHKPYEIKFKHINNNTSESYRWLISQYFRFPDTKFCCLVINRRLCPPPAGMTHFDVYINQLCMLINNNIGDDEAVILPDDISVPTGCDYEKSLMQKLHGKNRKCLAVHRIESHASIFLQLVDVLTGSVIYSFKNWIKEEKKRAVEKIHEKLGVTCLNKNFTKNTPNYFSVWSYNKQ